MNRSAFAALTRAQWRGFWREKQNWFWIMAFPLMFLLIFGFLFRGGAENRDPSPLGQIGKVALLDGMPASARAEFDKLFTTTTFSSASVALEQVRKGDLDAAVEQSGNEIVLHYSQADQVKAATVQSIWSAFVARANEAVSGVPPMFDLKAEPVEDKSLKPIQFLAPGLLGWAVGMGAIFNAAMPFVQWRQNKLLRRVRLAPMRTEALVASRFLVSIVVALVQTVLFIGVGVLLFGLKLSGSWWMVLPILICATFGFMTIGLLAGAVSKTAEAASGLANVIILPMAFLSGSFMPLDNAPGWLLTLSNFMPLKHLNEALMNVLVRGQGPSSVLLPMAILVGFGLVIGVLAARLFRWDD